MVQGDDMKSVSKWIISLFFLLLVPLTVSANEIDDISQIIREVQAQAIRNLGGITACDADAVMEESERILQEEYGINVEDGFLSNFEHQKNDDSLYDRGYDDGYSDGFKAGMLEAERISAAKEEEMRNNRMGAYFSVAIVVLISVVVSILDRIKYRRK